MLLSKIILSTMGDRIMFLKPDKKLGVANGRRATVLAIKGDGTISV